MDQRIPAGPNDASLGGVLAVFSLSRLGVAMLAAQLSTLATVVGPLVTWLRERRSVEPSPRPGPGAT